MRPIVGLLLTVSALSIPITLTHSVEDFSVGIHRRFGLELLPAAVLLSFVYAVQLLAAALSARDHYLGHALNLALAMVWLFAVVLDHMGEILFLPDVAYRSGLSSKALEVGIMLVATVWGVVAVRALGRSDWRGRDASRPG